MRWDIKTNSGPVRITAIDSFLMSSHGVYLDVGGVVTDWGCSFPSNNILDFVTIESSKDNDVSSKKRTVVPGNGVDVNSVVDSRKNALVKNVENG